MLKYKKSKGGQRMWAMMIAIFILAALLILAVLIYFRER